MEIVSDHDEIDLAYPLPPDVVAALAAVIRDEREQEDEEWAAFIAREKVRSGGVESGGVRSGGVESERVEVSTPQLPHSPTHPLTHFPTRLRARLAERERMRARLAERDAAYEREFGSAAQTGAVRGRVAGGSFRGFPLVSSMSYYG